MKSLILLFLGLITALHLSAQTDGDQLFDNTFLHEIRFESGSVDLFNQLVSTFNNSDPLDVPYRPGKVRIDGQLIDSVGVRIKGGSSAYNLKRPLKIDFNTYVPGQNIDGIKKLNLHNGDIDPSLQRDAVAYYLFRRAGVKAPRTAFARVYFNNTYHGVYMMVEQVDQNFLRENFEGDEGILYKNKICTVEVESGEDNLNYYHEINQIAASSSGTGFQSAIGQVLDTDAFLRYFLVSNFINAADNAIDVDCNYYIYRRPKTGRLYWIPWDFNYGLHNGQNYPLLHAGVNIVFGKMLQTPAFRQRYLQLACEMLDYLFADEAVYPFIDHNADLIRDAVADDPRFPYSFSTFGTETAAVKNLFVTRRNTWLADLSSAGYGCPEFQCPVGFQGVVINEFVASADSVGGIADPDGGYPDWVELYNNTADTVDLRGFYLSHDRDMTKHWPFPPGARIDPDGYLIVWADKDLDETGLHSDFKLAKSGGDIYLIYEDHTLVDSVVYASQNTNVAAARVPNGVGPFTFQAPTFGKRNTAASGVAMPADRRLQLSAQPNPAVETLTIRLTGRDRVESVSLRLVDELGRCVWQQTSEAESVTVDVRHFVPGLYGLVLEAGHTRMVKKLVLGR